MEQLRAICLMGFFGFYRLATLVPHNNIYQPDILHMATSPGPPREMCVCTISVAGNMTILTAHKVRATLKQAVEHLGLPSKEYWFHAFRRSGAYENNIGLQHIKTQEGWASGAIWAYLQKTPTAAGTVARSFQSALT